MMTFQESFGTLPMSLFRTYRKANVSVADHDQILHAFGLSWQDAENITPDEWARIAEFVRLNIRDGAFRMSRYV